MKRKASILVLVAFLFLVDEVVPAASDAFSITSPLDGAVITSGSTITVQVDSSGPGEMIAVMFISSSTEIGGDFVTMPPYEWTVQIPREFIGSLTFKAIGQMLGQPKETGLEAEVRVTVALPSSVTLQKLRVRDDQTRIFMPPRSSRKLYVYGFYSDGVERRVEPSSTGTTYETLDPRIATVDSEGMVEAIAPGRTVIKVKNGNALLQVQVFVKN